MSRAAFVENVAGKGNVSSAEARQTVDPVLGGIEIAIGTSKKEGRFAVGNFGTVTIAKRKARKGRNSRTGERIRIEASRVLRFRPAAALKRAAGAS